METCNGQETQIKICERKNHISTLKRLVKKKFENQISFCTLLRRYFELQQRPHSPLVLPCGSASHAAGLASESKLDRISYGLRFPVTARLELADKSCCEVLQLGLPIKSWDITSILYLARRACIFILICVSAIKGKNRTFGVLCALRELCERRIRPFSWIL